MRERIFIVVLALLVGSVGIASAADPTSFTGGTSTDFNNPANWNPGLPSGAVYNPAYILGGLYAETTASLEANCAFHIGFGTDGDGTLMIKAGDTVTSGKDINVGNGNNVGNPHGELHIFGTATANGEYSDIQVGMKGGIGSIIVYDGGQLKCKQDYRIFNGKIYYEAYAVKNGGFPKVTVEVENAGTIAFETDGSTVATLECSTANLDLKATSTLEMDLGGAFDNEQSWTLFSGISGMRSNATFGSISSPQGYTFTQALVGTDFIVTLTDAETLPVLPASSRDVAVDATLEWKDKLGDPNTQSYDVYINTDPCMLSATTPLVDNQLQYTASPTLEASTTYYWRVDSYEDQGGAEPNLVSGAVWKFTTASADPIVLSDPTSVTVVGGGTETAQFIMTGDYVETYKWYKQGVVNKLENDAKYSGADTGTLTIANVVKADEGLYHCVISNSSSAETDETFSAVLMTERLVGHWDFNGDLEDEFSSLVGQCYDPDTDTFITPTYVAGAGIEGTAAIEFNDDGKHIQIPGTEDLYNFYVNGVTVNAWIKSDVVNGSATIASKQEPNGNLGIVLRAPEGAIFQVLDATDNRTDHDPNNVDGQWHMITGTFDGQYLKIYVDGHIGEVSNMNVDVIYGSTEMLIFGAAKSDGSGSFEGLIDDVEIYSYALDHDTIAQKYADISGNSACKYNPELDLNGDCIINLYEFALVASQWMQESPRVDPN
jgi:hypothetical protein